MQPNHVGKFADNKSVLDTSKGANHAQQPGYSIIVVSAIARSFAICGPGTARYNV